MGLLTWYNMKAVFCTDLQRIIPDFSVAPCWPFKCPSSQHLLSWFSLSVVTSCFSSSGILSQVFFPVVGDIYLAWPGSWIHEIMQSIFLRPQALCYVFWTHSGRTNECALSKYWQLRAWFRCDEQWESICSVASQQVSVATIASVCFIKRRADNGCVCVTLVMGWHGTESGYVYKKVCGAFIFWCYHEL